MEQYAEGSRCKDMKQVWKKLQESCEADYKAAVANPQIITAPGMRMKLQVCLNAYRQLEERCKSTAA